MIDITQGPDGPYCVNLLNSGLLRFQLRVVDTFLVHGYLLQTILVFDKAELVDLLRQLEDLIA